MKLQELAKSLRAIEEHHRMMAGDRLRFAVELEEFLAAGGHEKRGYSCRWAYIDAEVRPRLGWSRAKVAKLLMAARELRKVMPLRRTSARAPSVLTLATLHTERRKQGRGAGRLAPHEFRRLEKKVANGLSSRALGAVLGLGR